METDKEKVWDRLKNGLEDSLAEKAQRLSQEYFESETWRRQKEHMIKVINDSELSTTSEPIILAKQYGIKDV